MQITAKVKEVRETVEVKTFSKREIIVTMGLDTPYPQDIPIEFHKDNTTLLDVAKTGDTVKIDCMLRGNYYEAKDTYYVSVMGWKIEVVEKAVSKEPVLPTEFNDQF